ncbi:hypothetical protein RRG08_033514 [Elysia crispata]|uniref:Uncharacterized protein n=1 Tax=Elysia crispata TaxID=231223 RepID=A0AAE0ZJC8_9GAST|nr:hypothetical protein RRG08_033514 [Elysia crispata]
MVWSSPCHVLATPQRLTGWLCCAEYIRVCSVVFTLPRLGDSPATEWMAVLCRAYSGVVFTLPRLGDSPATDWMAVLCRVYSGV